MRWLVLLMMLACERSRVQHDAELITGGDVQHGKHLVRSYGCGACHTIHDAPGATGTVGPPLDGVALRTYLAGHVANNVPNMIRWVRHPQALEPGVAMPEMGVTETDARDLAAYLYTLR